MGLSGRGDFVASCSFGGTWGNLLLPVLLEALGRFCCFLVLLEALFGRQFSWWKVTFFLSSITFGSYWLIVTWCIVLLLHPLPSVLLGLFVHLPFSFSASWLFHKSWGGVGI
jgi:hypothetical protein